MHVNVLIIFAFLMVWTTIEGLTLKPASDLTLQNFSLVCDLDGVSWSSPVQFTYGPNSGGGCGTPPNPRCVSSIGTITASNDQIITLKLFQSNIASLGEQTWTCSHGSVSVDYNATLIAVCSDGQVKQIGDEVDIRCSCGFPDVKATLKYKVSILQGKGPNIVDLQNSTGNCVGDSRAMDFIYRDNIPIGATELCISFTTLSQISESKEECIKITGADTTTHTTKTTTYSSFSTITTAYTTETTSYSTSNSTSPLSHALRIEVIVSVVCGVIIFIITIIIILIIWKQRQRKNSKHDSASHTQQKMGFENEECSKL